MFCISILGKRIMLLKIFLKISGILIIQICMKSIDKPIFVLIEKFQGLLIIILNFKI